MFEKKVLGERIRLLRAQTATSQQILAEHLGVGKSAVSMLENGQRSASLEIAVALADFFDVSLDYLVGRSDDPARR